MPEKTIKGNDLTRGERLQIMLTENERTALDDFRFSRRMPSRAAAVRELLRRGLLAEGFSLADAGVQSQRYGVIEGGNANDDGMAKSPSTARSKPRARA